MKYIMSVLSLSFTILIFWAFLQESTPESKAFFFTDPWEIVSLIDLYLGFLIFLIFIFLSSKSLWSFALWSLAVLILGNGISALYVAIFLFKRRSIQISS